LAAKSFGAYTSDICDNDVFIFLYLVFFYIVHLCSVGHFTKEILDLQHLSSNFGTTTWQRKTM